MLAFDPLYDTFLMYKGNTTETQARPDHAALVLTLQADPALFHATIFPTVPLTFLYLDLQRFRDGDGPFSRDKSLLGLCCEGAIIGVTGGVFGDGFGVWGWVVDC